MARIFISYRRADSRLVSNRIYDRLVQAFGKSDVFKDIDNIPPGTDFRRVLEEALATCQIMLVIIGPEWLDIHDSAGQRRLDDPNDFVRLEIQTGLELDKALVIPILVENAVMPAVHHLPDVLKKLSYKHAFTVGDDPRFHDDMTALIDYISAHLKNRKQKSFDWRWIVSLMMLLFGVGIITILPDLINYEEKSLVPSSIIEISHTITQRPLIAMGITQLQTPSPFATVAPTPKNTATQFLNAGTANVFASLAALELTYMVLDIERGLFVDAVNTNNALETQIAVLQTPTTTFTFSPTLTSTRSSTTAITDTLDEANTSSSLIAAQQPTITVSVESANLRAGPGTNYTIVGIARQGDRFDVLGWAQGWYLMHAQNGNEVWIIDTIVSLDADSTISMIPTVATIPPTPRVIVSEPLNKLGDFTGKAIFECSTVLSKGPNADYGKNCFYEITVLNEFTGRVGISSSVAITACFRVSLQVRRIGGEYRVVNLLENMTENIGSGQVFLAGTYRIGIIISRKAECDNIIVNVNAIIETQ